MSEQVRVRARPAEDSCPFCHAALDPDAEAWACEGCATRHHASCFRENGLRCTVLGCGGRPALPVGQAPAQESRLEKKRRKRRRRRERNRLAREAAGLPDPCAPRLAPLRVPPEPVPWFQGPVGLGAVLTLLMVIPALCASSERWLAAIPAALSFLGGLIWLYVALVRERR